MYSQSPVWYKSPDRCTSVSNNVYSGGLLAAHLGVERKAEGNEQQSQLLFILLMGTVLDFGWSIEPIEMPIKFTDGAAVLVLGAESVTKENKC